MSDGKEQYADSAFNKAAEAAMEAYKKKHYETWHMGADLGAPEGDRTAIHAMQEAEVDKLESRQYDYLRNWQGDTNTWVAPNDYRAWTAPRNQYEPLFPPGAALNGLPSTSGTMMGRSTIPAPPQQHPKERDPNGLDPHAPGAKLDAGKTPLRRGALEQFPRALMAVADVSAYGAAKYTWGGWQTVPDGVQRYLDAGARHAALRAMGESYDKESGLLHLAQEAWNILAALELAMRSDKLGI